jgi:hypothetical protein
MLGESLPPPVEYRATVLQMTVALRDEVEKNLHAIPIPGSISVLGISAELGLNRQPSNFRIEYLAKAPLSEDATALLTNLLEGQMKLSLGSLRFVHVPSRYSFRFNSKGELSPADRVQLQEVQNLMTQRPQLRAQVVLPDSTGEKETERLRAELLSSIPSLQNPARIEITSDQNQEPGTVGLLLQVAASVTD